MELAGGWTSEIAILIRTIRPDVDKCRRLRRQRPFQCPIEPNTVLPGDGVIPPQTGVFSGSGQLHGAMPGKALVDAIDGTIGDAG